MSTPTTRRYARSTREAWRDWGESCLGIEKPVETRPSMWERFKRVVREAARFLSQRSPWQ